MDIWSKCRDRISPEIISNNLIRVVESQEQIATNNLVDDLQEQNLLEQLLDKTKPATSSGAGGLHYLLQTPFRYPPLRHGSRFGSRLESSLFYGSHTITSALAETGYYRCLFWSGMKVPPPSQKFVTQHTIFAMTYASRNDLKLQHMPFGDYVEHLSDPANYSATQQLGSAMRAFGIEAFEFISARDPHRGINVALFLPAALATAQPLYQQHWLCETEADIVRFYSSTDGSIHQYALDTYLVKGILPEPAV